MLLPGVAMLIAIAGISDQVWSYFYPGVPYIISAVIILMMSILCYKALHSQSNRSKGCLHILFDSQGTWYQSAMPEKLTQDAPWQLTTQSRVIPLGLFLVFTDAAGQRHLQWILKGELPEPDYRRVVRAINAL